jgi:hypothetical protein
MEQVGRRGSVLFVNDSKGTNADAAAHALSSFADIFWIAGGKPKLGGITSLAEYFPRIRKAYLIGEAAQEFAGTLGNRAQHEISQTLEVAVANAARDAEVTGLRIIRPGPQFRNPRYPLPRSRHRAAGRQAGGLAVLAGQKREARLRARCPGHPRLSCCTVKTWMPGTRPGVTSAEGGSSSKDTFRINPLETIISDQWANPCFGNAHALARTTQSP